MSDFRRTLTGILIVHAVAYGLGQLLLLVVDPLAFVPARRTFVEPIGLGVVFSTVWFAWRVGTAIGHMRDILYDLRVRRRPARRPTSLADYMPGAANPRVNRAA